MLEVKAIAGVLESLEKFTIFVETFVTCCLQPDDAISRSEEAACSDLEWMETLHFCDGNTSQCDGVLGSRLVVTCWREQTRFSALECVKATFYSRLQCKKKIINK